MVHPDVEAISLTLPHRPDKNRQALGQMRITVEKHDVDSRLAYYKGNVLEGIFKRDRMYFPSLAILISLSDGKIPTEIIASDKPDVLGLGDSKCIPVEFLLRKEGEVRAKLGPVDEDGPLHERTNRVFSYFSGKTVTSYFKEHKIADKYYDTTYAPDLDINTILSRITLYVNRTQKEVESWSRIVEVFNADHDIFEVLPHFQNALMVLEDLHRTADSDEDRVMIFGTYLALKVLLSRIQQKCLLISHGVGHSHTNNFTYRFINRAEYARQLSVGECTNTNTIQLSEESVRFDPELAKNPLLFDEYLVETARIDFDVAQFFFNPSIERSLKTVLDNSVLLRYLRNGSLVETYIAIAYLPMDVLIANENNMAELSINHRQLFVWRLESHYKTLNEKEKWSLRSLIAKYSREMKISPRHLETKMQEARNPSKFVNWSERLS